MTAPAAVQRPDIVTSEITFARGQGNDAEMTRRAALEAALLARDGACVCFYCGGPPGSNGRGPIDHVTARSRGGSDSIENLVQACRTCNLLKGNVPGWFFVFWLWGRNAEAVSLEDAPARNGTVN